MKKLFNSKYAWLALVVVLVAINWLASQVHTRIDLTGERRYTLSAPTKALLGRLDDDIEVDLFLQGDLKAGIKKLSKSAQELLQEFNERCDGRIRVRVIDPLAGLDDSARLGMLDSLRRIGIQPKTQVAQSKKGEEQSQRIVIPGAILKYKDRIYPVDLLKGVQVPAEGQPEDRLYSNAETLLEYKFANAIDKVTRVKAPAIGYVVGNGEPLDFRVYDLIQDLRANYRFGVVRLDSLPLIPQEYDALIIVKPATKFTDREKLSLDQYLLHGGQLIWAIDNLHAEMDSLRLDQETVAYDRGLELEDLFFRYGVRVNQDLVEDIQSAPWNFVVGRKGDKPDIQLLSWPYFPLLNGSPSHPISKNLDPVLSKFTNSIDTAVKAPGIEKTVLLQTSDNGRTVGTPAIITIESIKQASDPSLFNRPRIPVAVLLEGKFRSLFTGRMGAAMADSLANFYRQPFVAEASVSSRVIVMGDADIVMNEVSQRGPLPMGFDKDNEYTFANKDFIENCVEFLVNPSRILETRSKDYTLRLLDPAKVEEGRPFWQFINIGLPVLLVVAGGYLYQLVRRKRYQGA